jgi:hypothetical protein
MSHFGDDGSLAFGERGRSFGLLLRPQTRLRYFGSEPD